MPNKRVLSIGQCAADHMSITWTLRGNFDAQVISADNLEEARRQLQDGEFQLVLVNRVLDANGASGLEVIKQLKAEEGAARDVPVMLVSNYDDAQQQAVRAGAIPGFGKAALRNPAVVALLKQYLG